MGKRRQQLIYMVGDKWFVSYKQAMIIAYHMIIFHMTVNLWLTISQNKSSECSPVKTYETYMPWYLRLEFVSKSTVYILST